MPPLHPTFDVLIVGLGAMGSAAAYHLAKSGLSVLGLDRFSPPHTHGSSHGESRIIREAYFEHPAYVPIVRRAYELWTDLERQSGYSLYAQTGGLMIGTPESTLVQGARLSAETHRLPYELLSAAQLRERFPGLNPPDPLVAIWEPRAGIVRPEEGILAHLCLARRHNAQIQGEEPVLHWRASPAGVRVQTPKATYHGAKLLLCAGSWLPSLWTQGASLFTVERQVLFWFKPQRPELFAPALCPIHMWEPSPNRFFYGFPAMARGVKLARHHEGHTTDPDTVRRDVAPEEIADMCRLAAEFLPALGTSVLEATTCLYTNSPDSHFVLDTHPDHPNVWIVSPCSGHGFKFAPAIGEIMAHWVLQGSTPFDLSRFRLGRLGPALS